MISTQHPHKNNTVATHNHLNAYAPPFKQNRLNCVKFISFHKPYGTFSLLLQSTYNIRRNMMCGNIVLANLQTFDKKGFR